MLNDWNSTTILDALGDLTFVDKLRISLWNEDEDSDDEDEDDKEVTLASMDTVLDTTGKL